MIIKIKLTDEIIKNCQHFADNSVSTHLKFYAKRNQTDATLIKKQILIGKLGEFATQIFLEKQNIKLNSPDLNIYQNKDKTFNSDLVYQQYKIHVKSQEVEQAQRFGVSWIFQYGNSKQGHIDKEIFNADKHNQYVSFVLIDLKNKIAKIVAFMNLELLHNKNLFKDPIKNSLLGIKKAIYYNDIKTLSVVDLWAHKQAFLDTPVGNPS